MCLGVPGRIVQLEEAPGTLGKVSFAGIVKDVCLACVPEAKLGDYVIVHVGFAIAKIDEEHALEVFESLRQMDALGALGTPQPG